MERLEEKLRGLPPLLQQEVEDFVEFLLQKQRKKGGKLKQDWAGALKDYRDKYTALELQKKALEWRED